MVVVLSGHQLVYKLVRPFDDLIDLLDLLLLYLLVPVVDRLLVLAVLLHGPPQRVTKRICVRLFYWRVVQRESQGLQRVHIRENIYIFCGENGRLLFVQFLANRLIEGVQFQICQNLLLVVEVIEQLRESFFILFEQDADGEDKAAAVPVD